MQSLPIEQPTPSDYDALTELWEASVRATHHFLSEEDILFFKPLVRNEFLQSVQLYCIREERIMGFMGIDGNKIEMLFIDPASRGKGLGKALLHYAVQELGVSKVDVNEQNDEAVGFYRKMGFNVVSRSEVDGMGKPYPILGMER